MDYLEELQTLGSGLEAALKKLGEMKGDKGIDRRLHPTVSIMADRLNDGLKHLNIYREKSKAITLEKSAPKPVQTPGQFPSLAQPVQPPIDIKELTRAIAVQVRQEIMEEMMEEASKLAPEKEAEKGKDPEGKKPSK